MSIFNKTHQQPDDIVTDEKGQELIDFLYSKRKNIPEKYNHGLLLDYLADDKTDLLFSITTRGDGKTFNYLYLLAQLSIKYDFNTLIIVRHMEVRNAMLQQLCDVYDTCPDLDGGKFKFDLDADYIQCYYDHKPCFVIADLNNANDLKNFSAVLRKCNLTLYDEFLAVGAEYSNQEFNKFKTIFETMDRAEIKPMNYTNHRRKALFLANPVDFTSEFLSVWDMYHMLESQPMNTIQRHRNICIERRKNEAPHEVKNSRIFEGIGENESLTGEFHINNYRIQEPDKTLPKITIKTVDKYINIYLGSKPILDVVAYEEHYQFNTELEDNIEDSTYLKDNYYNDSAKRKHDKGRYLYANQFSKSYILENFPTLNLTRIIKRSDIKGVTNQENQDLIFKNAEKESIKARLLRDYLL